jgi:hypothetical protein
MVDVVRILVDSAVPPISAVARVWAVTWRHLGGRLAGRVVAYVPSTDWRNDQTPPVLQVCPCPSPPAGGPDLRLHPGGLVALTPAGPRRAGTAAQVLVGALAGWRTVMAQRGHPWGRRGVVSARVLFTTTQVNIGRISPKSTLRRIIRIGRRAACPVRGPPMVVWPGPGTSSTGAVTEAVPGSQQTRFDIDATAIARAWAPAAAGGSGALYYGVALYSAGETNGAYTTEVWSDEYGTTASRPVLELTLDVLA